MGNVKHYVLSLCIILAPAIARADEPWMQYASGLSQAFENVGTKASPSVVSINAVKRMKAQAGRPRPGPGQDPMRDFFGDDFFDRFFNPQNPGGVQQGLGTGVIIDAKGYILTNNHVVGEADEINVKLSGGKTIKAELVGADPRTDLAVIKVKADGLTPASLGDSDALKIGEWVIAAGNPFGLENTITAGIVSAKSRANITDSNQYEDFIQTDAAINPGNSGGPLLNLRGQVVGINTAILSRSGGYMGIGFAIPINMARKIFESLISDGKVVRGWLGVIIQNLDENLAKSFSYTSTDGALIGDVAEGGPAAKAGLRQGDIVISYNGKPIKDVNNLRNIVADTKPGSSVDLEVFREGAKKKIAVKIEEQQAKLFPTKAEEQSEDLGMTVQNITPDIARELGMGEKKGGVVVTQVEPLGIAASAGLRPRDVIKSVNGKAVDSVSDFQTAVRGADLKAGIRLVVAGGGGERFVFLRVAE